MSLSAAAAMSREWKTAGGLFKLDGELESYDGKQVRLRLDSGSSITLPFEKMSGEDQAYLKENYPNGKERVRKSKAPATADADKPASDEAAADQPASDEAGADKGSSGEPADGADKPAARTARLPKPAGPVKPGEANVEVISLTVTKKLPEGSGAASGLVRGTHATVLVLCPTKTLLRLDAEKTKIACADDRATKLSKPPAKPPANGEATEGEGGLTMEVAPDGHSGTIVFDYPQTPHPKATRLRLKGDLHLVCGTEESPENVTVPLELIFSLGL